MLQQLTDFFTASLFGNAVNMMQGQNLNSPEKDCNFCSMLSQPIHVSPSSSCIHIFHFMNAEHCSSRDFCLFVGNVSERKLRKEKSKTALIRPLNA
ncbi:hypothetical protein KSP40_PGU005415 [Platanthera guangdongensis]|uniref:Uncharacterized protein n=1 Tax=Platanthera guangdongensis TaxID=2320717 RepID=A0ABR2MDE4_9ASPA